MEFILNSDSDLRMTSEDITDAITDKTKAIILNSPSNPTGSVMKKEDIKAIAEIADDNGIYLISDEVYEKIIYDKKHHSPAKFCENGITINGFSKSYAMTGFRIGYVTANIRNNRRTVKNTSIYNGLCKFIWSKKEL